MESKLKFWKNFFISLFIKQNHWHTSSVFGHTLKVMFVTLKHRDYKYFIPAFYHDFGKPFTATQDESDIQFGTYSFPDHEEKSFQIIKEWPFLSDWTKTIVRYHYLIRDIDKSLRKGKIERHNEKKAIFESLSDELKEELQIFMNYDDEGKKRWKDIIFK